LLLFDFKKHAHWSIISSKKELQAGGILQNDLSEVNAFSRAGE